jgi:hypothetical protein
MEKRICSNFIELLKCVFNIEKEYLNFFQLKKMRLYQKSYTIRRSSFGSLVSIYENHEHYSFAGISRSASVVIAYLMKELGLPMLDAMTYTRKKRPIIFPNPGF